MRALGKVFCSLLVALFIYSSVSYANIVEMRQERWDNLARLSGFEAFSAAYRSSDFPRASAAVNELLSYYPDEVYLYFLRGVVEINLGQYKEAGDDLAYYIQCDPADLDGYKMIVYACMKIEAYEDAMYYCQRGLAINADHTYLLKCESIIRERLAAERRQESFDSVGEGMNNPYMTEMLQFINEKRRQSGHAEVRMNAVLNQAAQKRAQEIITTFSHTRPDGTQFLSVLKEFDIPYHFAGEIAYRGGGGIENAILAWREKYTDKDLGIDPATQYVGIGYTEEYGIGYLVQIFIL